MLYFSIVSISEAEFNKFELPIIGSNCLLAHLKKTD